MHPMPAAIVGRGPIRLITVHGWMGDHRLFDPFLLHLDGDRFTCAQLDCRGYGSRQNEQGERTIDAVAHDIHALADWLGWRRFHCLGHSMGGMAAQRAMINRADRIASAILIATVPPSGAKLNTERRQSLLRAIASANDRRMLIDRNTGGKRDGGFLDMLLDISLTSVRADTMLAYMTSWTETDFAAEATGCDVPVKVVVGELDPGATEAAALASLKPLCPRMALHRIAGAGHYPMLEEPRALAEIVAASVSGR